MIVSLIAAMDKNRLIGDNNSLPWHLPADFAHFKKSTMGKPILMGRKTFESIGKPLPGRTNIVISRNSDAKYEGTVCVDSFDAAKAVAGNVEELMVIGGSAIYELLLPQANRMYLTYVNGDFKGDAWFPEFDVTSWREVSSITSPPDEKNKYECRFVTLEKN